ncbi:MAG: hypothetical protein WB821_01985, partial [Burkholderiaceae bacterium]
VCAQTLPTSATGPKMVAQQMNERVPRVFMSIFAVFYYVASNSCRFCSFEFSTVDKFCKTHDVLSP